MGVKRLAARRLRSPRIPTFSRAGGKEYDPLHEA
jgi:hypothetical protein